MIQNEDGTFTRPTTDSTIVYFAKTAPADGSCLVISNNTLMNKIFVECYINFVLVSDLQKFQILLIQQNGRYKIIF